MPASSWFGLTRSGVYSRAPGRTTLQQAGGVHPKRHRRASRRQRDRVQARSGPRQFASSFSSGTASARAERAAACSGTLFAIFWLRPLSGPAQRQDSLQPARSQDRGFIVPTRAEAARRVAAILSIAAEHEEAKLINPVNATAPMWRSYGVLSDRLGRAFLLLGIERRERKDVASDTQVRAWTTRRRRRERDYTAGSPFRFLPGQPGSRLRLPELPAADNHRTDRVSMNAICRCQAGLKSDHGVKSAGNLADLG